jgi:ribose/xylose/arabinose/galactoside ABC-type transport system permease subunit
MRTFALWLVRHVPWLLAGAILLALVLLVPGFQQARAWRGLSQQYFAPAALALALTPIVLTGAIDLSVGSVTVFSSVVIGALWRDAGWPIEWALAGGLAAALLAGLSNGALVCAGVLPLVATLATRELYRGLAFVLTGSAGISGFPPALLRAWARPVAGLPVPLLVLLALFGLTYLVVHHTWAGRTLFALGDNETAARFAGVPVRGLKLGLYAWSGLVAGLCGASLVFEYGAAKADVEKSLELLAIACVVLGGVRITGGAGHVAGTLLGCVTVAALLSGLSNVASAWRDTVSGAVLIAVAVANEASARWGRGRGREGD